MVNLHPRIPWKSFIRSVKMEWSYHWPLPQESACAQSARKVDQIGRLNSFTCFALRQTLSLRSSARSSYAFGSSQPCTGGRSSACSRTSSQPGIDRNPSQCCGHAYRWSHDQASLFGQYFHRHHRDGWKISLLHSSAGKLPAFHFGEWASSRRTSTYRASPDH